jgi:hypothetical protein
MSLNVNAQSCYAECPYAECPYAECRYSQCQSVECRVATERCFSLGHSPRQA